MGRYVKSISDTRELSKSLKDLEMEFKAHKNVIKKNSLELAKVNHQVEVAKEKEIQALAKKIEKIQNSIQWVENEEPAVKVNSEHMLKKLDIL